MNLIYARDSKNYPISPQKKTTRAIKSKIAHENADYEVISTIPENLIMNQKDFPWNTNIDSNDRTKAFLYFS